MLVALGFSGLQAAVIASIGHAWAVTFGSVAASFQALMAASGLEGRLLGWPAAALLGLAGFACGVCVLHAAGGWIAVRARWAAVLLLGSVMGGTQALMVAFGLWNLAAFTAGFAGLAAGVWLAARRRAAPDAQAPASSEVARALAGYVLLVALILLVQFAEPLRQALSPIRWEALFPAVETSRGVATPAEAGRAIRWLIHPGTLIAIASAGAHGMYRRQGRLMPGSAARIVKTTVRRTTGTTISVMTMVSMAMVMQHSGMTAELAGRLAAGLGAIYPAVAPWIGALGAFITGSNTNANVLFTALQQRTATLLGLSVAATLAAQTSGAAIASVLAPTKIVVGAATVGLEGREGQVLRSLAPYVLGVLLLISLAAVGLISLSG
jgi:lactate permease